MFFFLVYLYLQKILSCYTIHVIIITVTNVHYNWDFSLESITELLLFLLQLYIHNNISKYVYKNVAYSVVIRN